MDPGVEESGSLQWPPPLGPLTPVGHMMGMDDLESNRTGVEGWEKERIPPGESKRLQHQNGFKRDRITIPLQASQLSSGNLHSWAWFWVCDALPVTLDSWSPD